MGAGWVDAEYTVYSRRPLNNKVYSRMTGVQIGMDKDQSDDAIVPSQLGTSRRRRGSMRFAEARGHDIVPER